MSRLDKARAVQAQQRKNLTNMERFITKMGPKDENGCIPFTGHISAHTGYGSFGWRDKLGEPVARNIGAHRASFTLFKGSIPDNELVRHSCDNRACVNPDHLLSGTQEDNMRDCVERRRTARGTRQHLAKITEADVSAIRRGHQQGITQVQLAKEFGVRQCTVSQIIRRITWRHVP